MNPEINHEKLWKCGQWALKFLGNIDWGKMNLRSQRFLITIGQRFVKIYSRECNTLIEKLLFARALKDAAFDKFANEVLSVPQQNQLHRFALYLSQQALMALTIKATTRLTSEISSKMCFYGNFTHGQVIAIKQFCYAKLSE